MASRRRARSSVKLATRRTPRFASKVATAARSESARPVRTKWPDSRLRPVQAARIGEGEIEEEQEPAPRRRSLADLFLLIGRSGIDVLEGHDRHTLAVLVELEIFGGESSKRPALAVRDEHGNRDESDFAREDRRRGALLGRTRARNRRAATSNEKGREHPRAPSHIPSQRVMEPPMPVACKGRKARQHNALHSLSNSPNQDTLLLQLIGFLLLSRKVALYTNLFI